MKYLSSWLLLALAFSLLTTLLAAEVTKDGNLTDRTNDIKAQVIELNRDLFLLEEDLLHPASTRIALYLSFDFGSLFKLEAIKVKLDGKNVTSFLYTANDLAALKRGAIQPLYQGNISSGEHELVAFVTGIGTHNRDFKRAVSMKFVKGEGEKSFEIKIIDDAATQQPQFMIKTWK